MNQHQTLANSTAPRTMPTQWGLLACGSSGNWQIDVDEAIESGELALQMEGPQLYLRFVLSNSRTLTALLELLRDRESKEGFRVGSIGPSDVFVMLDAETPTRWFVDIIHDGAIGARFTLDANDLANIVDCLEDVKKAIANQR